MNENSTRFKKKYINQSQEAGKVKQIAMLNKTKAQRRDAIV